MSAKARATTGTPRDGPRSDASRRLALDPNPTPERPAERRNGAVTMTDLRALLGDDRYDDVIERAARALSERWNSMHTNESLGRQRMLADFTLAAVLPDLLAEANARAEDAEAKARRFANLLGNNAKALNDVHLQLLDLVVVGLPREVLRQKADAWDEGFQAAYDDEADHRHAGPAALNPYRQDSDWTEASQ